jgi:ribonuclease G
MSNEIVINASVGETRVGIIERNLFTELHIERDDERNVAGAVVKGRVTRVLPGMQAAFVDIGLEKAAFLYAGDYYDNSVKSNGNNGAPERSRGRSRNGSRQPPPSIDTLLREGQEIVVQVAKEPIGSKGARITSHISIAGRHLVVTPLSQRVGVSRRIESDRERRRLREIVSRMRPDDLGFIIRTAGDKASEADLEADIRYLTSVWSDIQKKRETASAPCDLYSELSLPLRVIRDFVNGKTKRIVIDDRRVYEEMDDFLTRFVAEPKPRLEHYQGALPIFDHFNIESPIDANLGKKIFLKSGGHLVIDQSEALTAVDVNTGRFVGKRDLEETVLRTNLEAVKEVVHQLRFRNIGGIIIIDLIDMESAENRSKVYGALQEALKQDKARTNILKISELGLVEMTRKRTRENLVQQLCEPCPNCEGRGYVLSSESMAYKVLREIRKDLPRFCGRQIAISVNPRVAEVLLARAHKACAELGRELGREIEVRGQPGLHQEQFEVTALDSGPPVSIPLQWLGFPPEPGDERVSTAELEREAGESASAAAAETTEPADATADGPDPEPTSPRLEAPRETAEAASEAPQEAAEAESEAPRETAEAASEAPRETAEAESEAPRETAEATSEAPREAAEAASEAPRETAEVASEAPRETAEAASEAPRETAEEEMGESVAALEPGGAESAREPAPPESSRVAASPGKASGEPIPAETALEGAPPEDSSTAESALAASAGAAEGKNRFAAPAPAGEMLDLEPKTPILPHPAEVEEK